MASFQASGVFTQSDDNLTLIFTDTSNYTDNTDGIIISSPTNRTLALYDSNNVLLATLTFTLVGGAYQATYTLTADVYVSGIFTITVPTFADFTDTVNYTSIGFYNTAFLAAMKNPEGCGCGCTSDNPCTDITFSQNLKRASLLLGTRGFGALSQSDITTAYDLLTVTTN